jgi:hypothetical protein
MTMHNKTDANLNVTALVNAATGDVIERYVYEPYSVTVLEASWAVDSDGQSDVVELLASGWAV